MRWTTAQHSIEAKRRNELNVRATGLAGVFLLLLFASFPICILFQGDLHLGDAFLFAPAFLFQGVEGFRLQSGAGGFSFTPKIELD
jgi:hypothetical protein